MSSDRQFSRPQSFDCRLVPTLTAIRGLPSAALRACCGSCLFSGSQEKFPTGGRFEVGVAQLGQIAGETGGFRFEDLAGFLSAVLLHIWREGNAYQVPYPAEAEEGGVTAGGFDAARGSEVDEDFGAPA